MTYNIKKQSNNVLYNINITIFAAEIKSDISSIERIWI